MRRIEAIWCLPPVRWRFAQFFHFLKRSFNRPVPGCFSGWFLFSWRSMSAIEICLPEWCETCSKEWRDLTVIKTVTGPSTSNSVRVVRDSSLSFSSSNQVKVVIKTKEVKLIRQSREGRKITVFLMTVCPENLHGKISSWWLNVGVYLLTALSNKIVSKTSDISALPSLLNCHLLFLWIFVMTGSGHLLIMTLGIFSRQTWNWASSF